MGSLGYADDVTLNSPSIDGLQKMLDICSEYGVDYDMLFNDKKTVCIAFGDNINVDDLPPVTLNGKPLVWQRNAKHLGNKFNTSNTDGDDIALKKGSLISNSNKLICRFQNSSHKVKTHLFRAYCCVLYGSQMWHLCSKEICNLITTWNKTVRRVFKLPFETHKCLLPDIINQNGIRCDLDTRWCKFIKQVLSNDNQVTNVLGLRNICLQEGIIGKNVKYLQGAYGISYTDLLHKSVQVLVKQIRSYHTQPVGIKCKAEQIVELMTKEISGFSAQEKYDMVYYLCTS